MEQQVVILNGIMYDYSENIKFYSMLGLLDQKTGTIRGIEFVSNGEVRMERLKECLGVGENSRLVCGNINEQIVYYTIDMQNGEIAYTKLKIQSESYAGRENILCTGFPREQDSKFKLASTLQYVKDPELKSILMDTLKLNKSNAVWNGLQDAANATQISEKVKILEA